MQAKRGTDLHELAKEAIRLGVKFPSNRKTINQYVNDAIGFRMSPEVVLKVSDNAFGTADCIGFRMEHDRETGEEILVLRIHDLKTGTTRASFKQLMIYCAYFCLEYKMNPYKIRFVVRIYQSDEVKEEFPTPHEIEEIMKITVKSNNIVEQMRMEADQ